MRVIAGRLGGRRLGAPRGRQTRPTSDRVREALVMALGRTGLLRPGARVVLEHHSRDGMPERCGTLSRERERRYGQTVVSTYRVGDAPL